MGGAAGSPGFSAWVDAFRWMAAGSVLLTHIGIRMLPPFAGLSASSSASLAYIFLAGFDHHAVMVFFVLSGLLVGGGVLREVRATGRFDWGRYVLRRGVRLCLVLWPALLLGACCTALALRWDAVPLQVLPAGTAAALFPAVLACNMAFLQTAACPQFGGNGALWSLFNEAWYYLLFPPLALALLAPSTRRTGLAAAALAALAGLTAVQFTGAPLGPYMLVWMAGASVTVLDRALRPRLAAALFLGALLAVRLLVRRSFAADHPLLSAELDLLLGVLFALLLASLRCAPSLRPPPWPALHRALASFSFSLYCTHIPILTLAITALTRLVDWRGHSPWPAIGLAWLVCVSVAWAFSRLTEAHTEAVRRWLSGDGRRQPAAGC